jgi:hypothetical protein
MCVNALGYYPPLWKVTNIAEQLRLVHHLSAKRLERKLGHKEQWILDALTGLNLVPEPPKDVFDRFMARKDQVWVSKWKRNRIKFSILHHVFIDLLVFIGKPGLELLQRVTAWVDLLSKIKRFRAHLKELRLFVNGDFLHRRDQLPFLTDKGKDRILMLTQIRTARKLGKSEALWKYYRRNFSTLKIFNKYQYSKHPLAMVVLESAVAAQGVVGYLSEVENFSVQSLDVKIGGVKFTSLKDIFSGSTSFPTAVRPISPRMLKQMLFGRVRKIQNLTAVLLFNWKQEVKVDFGFAPDVRFIANIGLNGLVAGPLIKTTDKTNRKIRFARPSLYGPVKVLET